MQRILLLLLVVITSLQMQAQEIWKDYVIGRPMQGHFEVKKLVAKEWGINYEAIFAGCVLKPEIVAQQKEYEASNVIYFKTLADRFGNDWQRYFNLDIQKKISLTQPNKDTGIWVQPIMGKPYIQHFDAKRALAKQWGINYEPYFLGCVVDETKTAEVEKIMAESSAYRSRLAIRFGEKWEEEFDREVKLEVAKRTVPIVPLPDDLTTLKEVWVDYVIGKPNGSYFEAKKAIAEDWGIIYSPKFVGCKRTPKLVKQQKKTTAKNEKYFTKLANRYGDDWRVHFDRAVQKKIAKNRLEKKG